MPDRRIVMLMVLALGVGACTVSPKGENALREEARAAGAAYRQAAAQRVLPELKPSATPDELVRYGLLANGTVERAYWEWRSAIERIPQEGTTEKNLTLSLSSMIDSGAMAWDSTSLGVTQEDLMLPSKLQARAQRALDEARAAGKRFDAARLALRREILDAYYGYALTAELARQEEANIGLVELIIRSIEARVRVGAGMQADLLKAANELEMARNTLTELQARLPQQRARINALLGRAPAAELAVPAALPAMVSEAAPDDRWLGAVAARNPELAGLTYEIRARKDGITIAKLQYLPDIELGFSTNLTGAVQDLMGGVMLPYLRYKALDAGLAQARAELRAAQAMRRQMKADLQGELLADLLMRRDAQRQVALLEKSVIPRAEQVILLSRSAYAAGQGTLIDVLDSQRSLIALRRMRAELQTEFVRRTAAIEATAGVPLPN